MQEKLSSQLPLEDTNLMVDFKRLWPSRSHILQVDDKPAMILELNISMEAPNITMPRSSDSNDAIEVDLGSLRLGNAVAWRNGNSMKTPEVSARAHRELENAKM